MIRLAVLGLIVTAARPDVTAEIAVRDRLLEEVTTRNDVNSQESGVKEGGENKDHAAAQQDDKSDGLEGAEKPQNLMLPVNGDVSQNGPQNLMASVLGLPDQEQQILQQNATMNGASSADLNQKLIALHQQQMEQAQQALSKGQQQVAAQQAALIQQAQQAAAAAQQVPSIYPAKPQASLLPSPLIPGYPIPLGQIPLQQNSIAYPGSSLGGVATTFPMPVGDPANPWPMPIAVHNPTIPFPEWPSYAYLNGLANGLSNGLLSSPGNLNQVAHGVTNNLASLSGIGNGVSSIPGTISDGISNLSGLTLGLSSNLNGLGQTVQAAANELGGVAGGLGNSVAGSVEHTLPNLGNSALNSLTNTLTNNLQNSLSGLPLLPNFGASQQRNPLSGTVRRLGITAELVEDQNGQVHSPEDDAVSTSVRPSHHRMPNDPLQSARDSQRTIRAQQDIGHPPRVLQQQFYNNFLPNQSNAAMASAADQPAAHLMQGFQPEVNQIGKVVHTSNLKYNDQVPLPLPVQVDTGAHSRGASAIEGMPEYLSQRLPTNANASAPLTQNLNQELLRSQGMYGQKPVQASAQSNTMIGAGSLKALQNDQQPVTNANAARGPNHDQPSSDNGMVLSSKPQQEGQMPPTSVPQVAPAADMHGKISGQVPAVGEPVLPAPAELLGHRSKQLRQLNQQLIDPKAYEEALAAAHNDRYKMMQALVNIGVSNPRAADPEVLQSFQQGMQFPASFPRRRLFRGDGVDHVHADDDVSGTPNSDTIIGTIADRIPMEHRLLQQSNITAQQLMRTGGESQAVGDVPKQPGSSELQAVAAKALPSYLNNNQMIGAASSAGPNPLNANLLSSLSALGGALVPAMDNHNLTGFSSNPWALNPGVMSPSLGTYPNNPFSPAAGASSAPVTPKYTLADVVTTLEQGHANVTDVVRKIAESNLDVNKIVRSAINGRGSFDEFLRELANSKLDVNEVLRQVVEKKIDVNTLIRQLAFNNVSVDAFFRNLAGGGVNFNNVLKQLAQSNLDLDASLIKLKNTGIDASFVLVSPALPGMINAGILTNPQLGDLLATLSHK